MTAEKTRLEKAWPALLGVGCLAVGLVIGGLISAAGDRGYRVPSAAELERLCSVDRDVKVRRWEYVILHHSASEIDAAASIGEFHREGRGWGNGLGYDFVIGNGSRSGDGEIEAGRRWRRQLDGAHCKAGDMNKKAIGICFVGNFETGRRPSRAQTHSGVALMRHLAATFCIPPGNVLGHREVPGADTRCPGRLFPLDLMRAAAACGR